MSDNPQYEYLSGEVCAVCDAPARIEPGHLVRHADGRMFFVATHVIDHAADCLTLDDDDDSQSALTEEVERREAFHAEHARQAKRREAAMRTAARIDELERGRRAPSAKRPRLRRPSPEVRARASAAVESQMRAEMERHMRLDEARHTVACSTCGAGLGEYCRTAGGSEYKTWVHAARHQG